METFIPGGQDITVKCDKNVSETEVQHTIVKCGSMVQKGNTTMKVVSFKEESCKRRSTKYSNITYYLLQTASCHLA